LAQYAVKRYSSNRRIPENLDIKVLEAAMERESQRSFV